MATTTTHYTPEAYKLKYYHEHKDLKGLNVRLEVYMRTQEQLTAKAIGELTTLQIQMQGAQDAVDSAIVKTSLVFAMVDTYDKADTDQVKHGDWQEFYTPDSTLYLVIVKTKPSSATEYTTRWSGYITPDSWQESLDYYGSISVTARDNIGHLQDFEFDAAGDDDNLISVYDLITAAAGKVSLPMTLQFNDQGIGDAAELSQGGISMRYMMVNVKAFEGKSWYSALETALGDLGWCLRYTDNNTITVCPLRNMSLLGNVTRSSVRQKDLVFLGGGNKIVDPAYKSIVDEMAYDYHDDPDYDVQGGQQWTGETASLEFDYEYPTRSGRRHAYTSGVIDKISNPSGKGWKGENGHRKPMKDSAGVDVADMALVPTNIRNNAQNYVAIYDFGSVHSLDLAVVMAVYPNIIWEHTNGQGFQSGRAYLKKLIWKLTYKSGGTTYYYNSEDVNWVAGTEQVNTYEAPGKYDTEIRLDLSGASSESSLPEGGVLTLYMRNVEFYGEAVLGVALQNQVAGLYLGIQSIGISRTGDRGVDGNIVRSVNDEKYNVESRKNADIGVMSRQVSWLTTDNYRNVLYKKASAGAAPSMAGYNFTWGGDSGLPLPVMIHLQRFCFHLMAMEILEGNCQLSDGSPFSFRTIYKYKGSKYLLISGTLDLVTGRMCGGVYRQYLDYTDVWGERTPEYTINEGGAGQTATSTGGTGSGSSGSSGGGGSVYSVGVEFNGTGITVQDSPVTTSGTIKLALADGYEIPQSARVLHNDGGDNAVMKVVVVSEYPSVEESGTLYIKL